MDVCKELGSFPQYKPSTLPPSGRLDLDHHFALSTGLILQVTTIISTAVLLVMLVFTIMTARERKLVSFCLLWFLGNLIIESIVISLEILFGHRNYTPSMMFILLLVALFSPFFRQQCLKITFPCFIVLLLSIWTSERNRTCNDKISLWHDRAAKSPEKT